MTKEQIFELVKNSIREMVPEINTDNVRIEQSLRDLGVNSIDRMDIVIKCMEDLNLKIPLVEFGKVKNIAGIVELLYEKSTQ
ncbi:MAG: acyl carrier protein [Clostridia bacterium]|nr:acyl carrier protein [Clostridia bacterium]